MKTIELENGYKFQSWWGGEYVRAKNPPAKGESVTLYGDCNMLRRLHNLRLVTIEGKAWIMEYQKDKNYPSKSFAHWEMYSTCGRYKVARYGGDYRIYEAFIWRKNMKSTFGNHVPGIGDKKFNSAKEACQAVANLT